MSNTKIIDTNKRSSWILSVAFRNGFLAIFLARGGAILYSQVPPYIIGLLTAAQAHAKTGNNVGQDSLGATYHRLVKGKYTGQTIEDAEEVQRLKEMMS